MKALARHALADRGDDFYPSPPEATYGLLVAEGEFLPHQIWEPACGDGAMVRPLRAAGYDVTATDLVDRGCQDSTSGVDFLMERRPVSDVGAIVTNPPFKLADQFVETALHFVPYVAMLLRLQFLESERRRPLFERWPLAAAHIFSARLPMMHRAGWDGPRTGSSVCYAWFVFDKRRQGQQRIGWISADMIAEGERICGGVK